MGGGEIERERESERGGGYGPPKFNVLTSGSPVANPKCGPDYSVFIAKSYIYIYIYISILHVL
jgi:hypothetical protein